MRGITLSDEFVSQIVGKTAAKISESTEAPHAEAHVCPLCESHLEEPLSEERIQEHVDYFLDVINENFDIVGDNLDEEEVQEDGEELDESGEVGDEEESDDEYVNEKTKTKKPLIKPPKSTGVSRNPGCWYDAR